MRKKVYCAFMFLIFSTGLFASGGESAGGWGAVIGSILNSGILWGLLGFFLYKPLTQFFKKQSNEIKEKIDTSKLEKERSEEKLKKIEERLSKIEFEIEEIRNKAKEAAEKEERRIKEQLDEDLKRISSIEESEIESIINSAKRELKKYATELSVSIAEKDIKEKINEKKHKELIKKFIDDMENVN